MQTEKTTYTLTETNGYMLRLLATHHHAVQEYERFYVLIQPDYCLLIAETCSRCVYIKTLNCAWRIY